MSTWGPVLRSMGACTSSRLGGHVWECDGKVGSAFARGFG